MTPQISQEPIAAAAAAAAAAALAPFPAAALAPVPAPAPSPTAVPASAAAVAAASRVFSNPVRKNTPQMTPKISQEPTAAAAAAAAAAVPAGRGQDAPLPRPVAAAAATPGPPGAGTLEITMVAAARGAGSRVFSNPVRKNNPKTNKNWPGARSCASKTRYPYAVSDHDLENANLVVPLEEPSTCFSYQVSAARNYDGCGSPRRREPCFF